MKKYLSSFAMVAITGLTFTASCAQALIIQDTFIGDTTDTYGNKTNQDVYGGSGYDITSMAVTHDNIKKILTVTINASDYFALWAAAVPLSSNNTVYGPGSLFLSIDGWTPNGNEPYLFDKLTNGTTWEYAVALNNLIDTTNSGAHPNTAGTANLYATSNGTSYAGAIRTEQEAWFEPSSTASLGEGSWSLTASSLTITMDLSQIWDGTSALGLHWTMTCANDVIEGQYSPVPEPTTALLLGTGLVGLAGVARRRKS